MACYQGRVRSQSIIRQFCEQNIHPTLDPLAIEEIYVDSEYTKEGDVHYFTQTTCKKRRHLRVPETQSTDQEAHRAGATGAGRLDSLAKR